MSFRWNSKRNGSGYPGYAPSTGGALGLGQHGSMSRHELRNILFARGPSFRQGLMVDAPSGNTDLAPTILRILGIESEAKMDGRVLEESLAGGDLGEPVVTSETYKAERAVPSSEGGTFRQQVGISRVGETTYVDYGNASTG